MSKFKTKPIPDSKPEISRVKRPWGNFSQYANNAEVTVTLMTVKPNQRLSYQSHTARAELWIAIDEGARVRVDDEIIEPKPGDEIWIPVGANHRLSSTGPEVRVLEIAFGNWQQEDIKRYDDDYDRPGEGE